MANEPVYVTFEFRGNLEEEVNKVTLGIRGLRDESAKTYQRLIADSSTAFNSMSAENRKLAVSIQENINTLRELGLVQKALDAERSAGTISTQEYTKAQAALAVQEDTLRNTIMQSTQLLNERVQAEKMASDSVVQMNKRLQELLLTYNNLAKVDREGAQGQALIKQMQALQTEVGKANQALREQENTDNTAADSITRLNVRLRELVITYNNLSKVDRDGAQGQNLLKQIQGIDKEVNLAQSRLSQYSRATGTQFNGLSMSIQQVARELPSLTMGVNMFFLAVSNNVPILADYIKAARIEYDLLKQSGQAAIPVWKQVLSSIISWQTALVVGITLLTAYGKDVINWASALLKGGQAAQLAAEAQETLNSLHEEAAKNAAKETAQLQLLYGVTQDTTRTIEERTAAAQKLQKLFPDYFGNLSTEIILVGNAKTAYEALTKSIEDAAAARILEDKYAESVNEMTELLKRRRTVLEQIAKFQAMITEAEKTGDNGAIVQAREGLAAYGRSLREINASINAVSQSYKDYQNAYKVEAIPVPTVWQPLVQSKYYDDYVKKLEELRKSKELLEINQDEFNKKENEAIGIMIKAAEAAGINDSSLKKYIDRYKEFNKLEQQKKQDKVTSKETNKEQKEEEAANVIKSETAMRLLEIAHKQQAVSMAEKESELAIRQNKNDLLGEGSAKELEQLRLNHEKRLLEIRRAGEEQVKAQQDIEFKQFEANDPNWKKKGMVFTPSTQNVNQLPEQQKKYLEDMEKQADALLQKSISDYYKKELDAYMTYAEKRLSLQKQYAKLREDAEASGNTARIENINREEKESLEKIDTLFGEREASFQGWANGIVNLSLVQLGQLLDQAQAKLVYARAQAGKDGKLGENDETAKYRAQIVELQARIKELTVNTQKNTGTSFKDWKKVYSVLGDVNDELNEIGDNVGGATGEIIGMASNITTSTLSMISGITTLANWSVQATRLAAEGASKAIIAVERASVILAIISAAIQIISKIINALDGLKDAERDHEEYMKLLISLQEEYNKKLVETQLLQDDVWGTDGIGNMIDAIGALGQAMDNYNGKLSESQKEWKDPTGNFWKKLYQYGTIMGWVGLKPGQLIGAAESGPGTTDLRNNLRYVTKKSSKGFMGIGGNHTKTMNLEEWVKENIKNPDGSPANLFYEDGRLNLEIATSLVENNGDRLAGETKESLEALIELEESIRAAEEAMRDYISDTFGSLGDGLSDAIVDAFRNGTDAAETFRENINEVLEDVGRQMVRNLFVQKAVEAYEDELEKVYKNYAENRDDNSTADEEAFNKELANATQNFFSGALSAIDQGNKFLEMYDAEMKKHGFDPYKPTDDDRQAAAKGITSMSQDSADQLNGNFYAMLIYLDKTGTAVTNINTLLVQGLDILNRIAANTDRLENIESYMKLMSSNMQQILNNGLIMRKS